MYAIVRQSGKQYRVSVGDELVCDRIKGKIGESVKFDKLLLISDSGNNIVGSEELAKYHVEAELVENFDDEKINVFKYKSKKGYRRLLGHRQQKSKIIIEAIGTEKDTKIAKKARDEEKAAAAKDMATAKAAKAAKVKASKAAKAETVKKAKKAKEAKETKAAKQTKATKVTKAAKPAKDSAGGKTTKAVKRDKPSVKSKPKKKDADK